MSNIYKNIKDNYEEINTFTTLTELKGSKLFVYCMIGGNNGSISQGLIANLTKNTPQSYISVIINKLIKEGYIECISKGSKADKRPAKYKLLKEDSLKGNYFRINTELFDTDEKCSLSALARYLEMRISSNKIFGNTIFTLKEKISPLEKELIDAGLIEIVTDGSSNYVVFIKEKNYEFEDNIHPVIEKTKNPWDEYTKKELWDMLQEERKSKIVSQPVQKIEAPADFDW